MGVDLADAGPYVTQCVYCGRSLREFEVTDDHIVPKCRGGNGHPANVAPSCGNCNHNKGPLTAKEFIAVRKDRGMLKSLYNCISSHIDPCREPVDNKASHLLDRNHMPITKKVTCPPAS